MGMNINGYTNALNAYLHTSGEYDAGRKNTPAASKTRNTDKVEFSAAGRAKTAESDSLTAATASARVFTVNEVNAGASPERLSALKSAVASGNYYIPSADIASAMLGD